MRFGRGDPSIRSPEHCKATANTLLRAQQNEGERAGWKRLSRGKILEFSLCLQPNPSPGFFLGSGAGCSQQLVPGEEEEHAVLPPQSSLSALGRDGDDI